MSTILNTVYNNYLTTYAPKSISRYDTHKKSELRSVYNSIVKLNKESPWYLPTTSKETQQYAVNIKENARELRNTISQLGSMEEDGLFSKKSAYSSDEEIATVTYIGEHTDAKASAIDMEVKQLATPQENLGLFLENSAVDLPAGTYSFDIAINDMSYEFQFAISENETNHDIQERLVRLINNADIRLKASLTEDSSRSAIRLVSEATGLSAGKSQIFNISDAHSSKLSGTVDYFGLDYVSHEASNALFTINGKENSSPSNHFTIDKQYEVQLNGISPEGTSIKLGLKTDMESLTDNVLHLVNGYNDFMKAAASYIETQSRSRQLLKEFRSITSNYSSSLESMGVNMSEDGTLKVDNELLRKTAEESQDISETFGYLKPFSNMLLQKSNQVSLNPMDYVDKVMVAYKNPGRSYVSPYNTSAYTGMLFNGYC